MSLLILAPTGAAPAYTIAAQAFQSMYKSVTEITVPIAAQDDLTSDLIVIGSDSVNDYLMCQILDLKIDRLQLRYGTDDYCILSHKDGDRNVLILAGGRGRSTIYAVYDYFERFADCHYFWDGDVIPHKSTIPLENISVYESPRFEYRGLRYFAHRGLKRFQAEHWDFADWKQELTWMVKKRMNFFMLRIGMDDIWQKAFPEDVPYPEGYQTIPMNGFHDRSDFWSLKHRGELRLQILQYARDLDLCFPVDCGTMTHWYSRTPQSFLDRKQPSFVTQEVSYYADGNTGNVFDFTNKEMMSYYTRLTETMVKEYEKDSSLFHTIGLGERSMFTDPKKNFALKNIAYRRISEEIRVRYPHAKLMLATWDFAGWWHASEVEQLTKELDPERTMILDYTCEVADPKSSFLNWGLVGKFPWIFGIFHAFESESELRGPYDRIQQRFALAADDSFCKGMIYWPELSHSDPLILQYLSENCWQPIKQDVRDVIATMCQTRYGRFARQMETCWQTALPVIKLGDWGSRTQRSPDEPNYEDYANMTYSHTDLWTRLTLFLSRPESDDPVLKRFFVKRCKKYADVKGVAADALAALPGDISREADPFIFRDVIDLARTMLGRYMNLIIMAAVTESFEPVKLLELKRLYTKLLDTMIGILRCNPEFSMEDTMQQLKASAPVNPNFEITLKHNLCNNYCLQAAYEPAKYLYRKEIDAGFQYLLSSDADKNLLTQQREALLNEFWELPLAKMQDEPYTPLQNLLMDSVNAIRETEDIIFS